METTMSHTLLPFYHPHQLVSLVGDYNTELPDDVVVAMLNMMRAHADPESAQYIGYYTPAEIVYHTAETPSHLMPVLPGDKNILHIHNIHRHWITTFYSTLKRTVFVCDSLQNHSHSDEIIKQVKVIYGDLARVVKYLPVTQQSTNPTCGPMAIAFAVAFFLNSDPSEMHFNLSRVREHLKVSLNNGTVTQFPTVGNTVTNTTYYTTNTNNRQMCDRSPDKEHESDHLITPNRHVESSSNTHPRKLTETIKNSSKHVLTKREKVQIQKQKDRLRKSEQRASKDTQNQKQIVGKSKHVRSTSVLMPPASHLPDVNVPITTQTLPQHEVTDIQKQISSQNKTVGKSKHVRSTSVLMPPASHLPDVNVPITTQTLPQHEGTDIKCHPVPEGYTIPKIGITRNTVPSKNVPQKVLNAQQCNINYMKKRKPDSVNKEKTNSENQTKTMENKVYSRRKYMRNLMAMKRQNLLYRQEERHEEANAKRLKRRNETYSHKERTRQTIDRNKKRANRDYRAQEKIREATLKKEKRADGVYRQREQDRETSERKKKREDCVYRQREQNRDTSDRKKKRNDADYREQEKILETTLKKKKRADSVYRQREQDRETSERKKKREDCVYRQREQNRDTSDRKKKRNDADYREQEKILETTLKKKKRADSVYRQREQNRDTCDRQEKRKDSVYREQEKILETTLKKKKRADSVYRQQEQNRDTCGRQEKRKDSVYREQEKILETTLKKKKRADSVYRQQEQNRETCDRKKKRKDSNYKEHEKILEATLKKKRRSDSVYRQQEQNRENITRKRKRSNIQYRKNEAELKQHYKHSKKQLSIDELTEKFHTTVQQGPVYICTSCKQLFYKHSVNRFTGESNKYKILNKPVPTIQSVDNKVWICRTCKSYISKGKVPPVSVMNKMLFPEQGQFKDLNPLEQNLLAVRLPFMKIHEAPRGKQKFIHGNMVLVPADVDNTVTQLPRLTSNTGTIKATLKRKLKFKHHVYCVNIRPLLVKDCARILSTKPLYKDHITFDNTWENHNLENTETHTCNSESNSDMETTEINNMNTDSNSIHSNDIAEQNDLSTQDGQQNGDAVKDNRFTGIGENETSSAMSDISCVANNKHLNQNSGTENEPENQTDKNSDDETWSEIDDDELTAGMSDTLLSAQDFMEPNERDLIYNFAPGEGSIPVSIFLENDIEELAFPGIFCGERRVSNQERSVNITYGEIVKSELRNADRRAACSIENIFFKAKKIQMKILIDQAQLVLRKIKTKNQHLTVKDIRGNAVTNLIHSDKAYKALANIRGSPPYFEKVSKDLFAMIRQLGAATFFVTLSAAETRWTHLLSILGKLIDNKTYTEEELTALTWQDKCRLIQSDPVTCARHFDYSVNKFLNEFLLTTASPLGEIEDYFYRVEYQNRGSPHIHMVIWCKKAPSYGFDPENQICDFVDKYISCFLPEDDPMYELVKLQIHRHSHTCRKGKHKICRFGFPKPLFDKTVILEPLSQQECSKEDISSHKAAWKKVYAALNEFDDSKLISLSDFLAELQMTEQQYIFAVRSSIKTSTIFLKRSSIETRVNNYNPSVLKAWRANIDVQYILDVYACATYVASYLTKSQRGMSELLRKATHEANQGNSDIRHQVKEVGNKFLNAVEISAQEAVYICLQLPMKKSSRHVVFVNTSPPEERVSLLKPRHLLDTMDDDDEDIECNNLLSRYAGRPKTMQNITLAEFAASYEKLPENFIPRNEKQLNKTIDNFLPEPHVVENEDDIPADTVMGTNESTTATTKYRKRTKPNIIRSVHFNPDVDTEKYFRELIMLYFPWTDENNLMSDCETFFDRYKQLQDQIQNCRKIYEPYATQVDIAEQVLASQPDLEEAWNELAPGTENDNLRDGEKQLPIPDTGIEQYNIAGDLGLPVSISEDIHDFHELPDQLYRQHMRSLNLEQIEFVNDTIHQLKTSEDQIFRFLSGGAGVGKSFLIKGLYQTALKYLNKHAGDNFTTRRILLLAPTGKAAYHIQGSTIHNGLKIPANNKLEHRPLPSGQLNTLRNQIGNVKLLIIDEISMVGFRMFNCIHQRLQEVMQNGKPFGGVSVIVVGDLFQLEPVFDSYVFQQPRSAFLPLAVNLWTELFKMYELKQIMRQAESKHFAELLNRLREGKQTNEDLHLLKTRLIKRDSPNYPHHATHLMHKNDDVNAYNEQIILRSKNKVFTINAKDRVVGSTPHYMRQKILMNFRNSHSKTCQLPNVVSACEGIHYDLTVNLNTTDGLTNGASCQIMHIDIQSIECYASGTIWVKFHSQSVGKSLRTENKHLYKHGYDQNWTPIQPTVKEFAAGNKGQAQIQRCQFPIRPSHAKSIHRSQGDTLDEAVLDLTISRRLNHIHYVAISRLKSLDGLHILNLQEDKISIDKHVQTEMLRLRNEPLTLPHKFLYKVSVPFKLAFLNARSLNRHFEDVQLDSSIQSADVICFCETRFCARDPETDTAIKNYTQYRQDFTCSLPAQRPPYGLAVYSKTAFVHEPNNASHSAVEATIFRVQHQPQVLIACLYKPPKVSTKSLLDLLLLIIEGHIKDSKAVILGDLNINWNDNTSDKQALETLMHGFSFQQIVKQPTNDFNSTIDLIFTNIDNFENGTLEAYYSDHKLCWIAW